MKSELIKRPAILNYSVLILIGLVVVLVNTYRFLALEQSPPGFHVDELSGAVSVQCLEQEGHDALDHPYPLFADLNYGSPKPPTYIYPAILWTKVFGHSIVSYRAFSGLITVLSIGGIFWLMLCLFDIQAAAWACLLASVSPTVFQFSRIALEAGLAPLFLIWGMLFYVAADQRVAGVGAGTLFALAMYSYPPARLFVPLFVVMLMSIRWIQGQRNVWLIAGTLVALVIVSVPLVLGTLSGAYMGRFNKIGILSPEYLSTQGKAFTMGSIAGEFIQNYGKHISPSFLFLTGDKNFVYSTGKFGLVSWTDMLALLVGVVLLIHWVTTRLVQKKPSGDGRGWSVVLLVLGVLLSVVPAALTWEDIPHSLRMILFWPFLAMINGVSLAAGCRYFKGLAPACLILSGIFLYSYLSHYFRVYPERSYYMFSAYTKDEVLRAKTKEDWLKFMYRYRRQNFHLRYYLMNYLEGQTCSSSQVVWKEVHKIP